MRRSPLFSQNRWRMGQLHRRCSEPMAYWCIHLPATWFGHREACERSVPERAIAAGAAAASSSSLILQILGVGGWGCRPSQRGPVPVSVPRLSACPRSCGWRSRSCLLPPWASWPAARPRLSALSQRRQAPLRGPRSIRWAASSTRGSGMTWQRSMLAAPHQPPRPPNKTDPPRGTRPRSAASS